MDRRWAGLETRQERTIEARCEAKKSNTRKESTMREQDKKEGVKLYPCMCVMYVCMCVCK